MSTPRQEVYSDRYAPLSLIARGGMAEVWLAHDNLLDRTVALKVLFPELSKDHSFVERFRREAQAAANLSHPNIVSIYDWGEAGTTYFIVMEYVEGRPLSRLLREEGPLLADRAASIGADAAAALGFAHRNGVIHRDVKPGNILITGDDHVKVTDFGIAQAANTDDDHLTKTGAVMGTATYFSPEQAQGLPVDQRSDVYSLGVVLYEMVTGSPPFTADSPVATAYKHVHEQAAPPTAVTPELPKAFESVVMQAMAKDATKRYASAEELRADLLRFRQGRGVLAEPVAMIPAAAAVPPPAPPPRRAGGTSKAASGAAPTKSGAVRKTAAPKTAPAPPRTEVTPKTDPDAEVTPEGHGPLWGYAVLLAVLLIALVVVLVLLGRQLSLFGSGGGGSSNAPVAVPASIIGAKYDDAVTALARLGVTKVTRKDISDTHHPADTVTASNPAPNQIVRGGGPIELDVASGPPAAIEPDVQGEELKLAIAQLKKAGFVVASPITKDSTTTRAGDVISQDPPALNPGHQGDTVTLTVSAGRGQSFVPDETGKDQATAQSDLQQRGFVAYLATHEHSATVAEGGVVRTIPVAGSAVATGSRVGLVISSGPGEVKVPYVKGDDEATAHGVLEEAGLVVAESTQSVATASDDGIVLSVDPPGGTTVQQGSTVNLVIGRYGSAISSTPPTSQ
ncbi:MAG: Stk1 family PASTA domain-containing Ser/Thr kinase [Acidimicrobiales bacterium]